MKQFVQLCIGLTLGVAGFTSCVSVGNAKSTPRTITYELSSSARPDSRYSDLTHGVDILVSTEVTNNQILDLSQLNSAQLNHIKNITFEFVPTIKEFVSQSMKTYFRSAGISVGKDYDADYRLMVRVTEFKFTDGASPRATVIMDYTLVNPDNETILQQTARGRYASTTQTPINLALEKAYDKALADIDLDGIASALKVHKRADQERTRQVKGEGNTALEHTVIRWFIQSTPPGADVSWRVVSSTPDVKNTNLNYVGTTPYETTESFDIRGLTWENAGNVQIEVTCERAGYLPQKRRFNLLQAIEQKEISAKFNLVKDE